MGILVQAPAKINLCLDITGRREDGYHLVNMVMQSVNLYDTVEVAPSSGGISLSCSRPDLPVDETNLAYRAARLYLDQTDMRGDGVSIRLQKNIPMAAGLAGGSSDAAAVLVALNHLYGRMSSESLLDLGAKLGADVPFCVQGGTSLAQGIGTSLSSLFSLPDCFILLCKPDVGISTPDAYRRFDDLKEVFHPDVNGMISALKEGNVRSIASFVSNVFEQVVCLSELDHIRGVMKDCGAMASCMSGSGPTVFGLFSEETQMKACRDRLMKTYREVYDTRPVDHGCKII